MARISNLHGEPLTGTGSALEADVRTWCVWVQEALESAWYATLIAENTAIEERYYWQGLWTATAYDSGSRVYHADTATWYDANDATLSTDVPGISSKWDAVDTSDGLPFPRKLLVDDEVHDVIPEVVDCWAKNPMLYPSTLSISKPLTVDDGHWFGESAPLTSVWVKYRKPLPASIAYDADRLWADETLPAVYEGYIVWYVMALSYMDKGQMDRMGEAQRKAGAVLDVQILNQLKGRPNKGFIRRGY